MNLPHRDGGQFYWDCYTVSLTVNWTDDTKNTISNISYSSQEKWRAEIDAIP